MKPKCLKKHSHQKQLELIPTRSNRRFFGGALLKGRRKSMRPLSKNEALHFVLRSQFGRGVNSFRSSRNYEQIDLIISRAAKKYGIKIYRRAIQSNHIHLIFRITNRRLYRCFISVITGKIAQQVMQNLSFHKFLRTIKGTEPNAGEGVSMSSADYLEPYQGQAFWDYRPFHRILKWGKDYQTACRYLLQNTLEALGFIAYKERPKNNVYTKYLVKISLEKSVSC